MLNRLKTLPEDAVVNKLKTVEDCKVFVCEFLKLQLPRAKEARSLNHVSVRQAFEDINFIIPTLEYLIP